MKALSVKQPWLWAITDLDKRIENRTWKPPAAVIGQRIALHAGKKADAAAYATIAEIAGVAVPADIPLGAIVATAKITGYIQEDPIYGAIISGCDSPCRGHLIDDKWFFGPIGWILDDIRKLKTPIPCRGALGLWTVGPDIIIEEED